MQTTTRLEKLIETRYDVSPMACDVTVISWAAEILAEEIGFVASWALVKRLNSKRERAGRMPFYPDYAGKLRGAWLRGVEGCAL